MNKHLYRIIFNKARGLLMVVAENATRDGKAPGTTVGQAKSGGADRCVATLLSLRLSLMTALGLVALAAPNAWAGIVADERAPANQRPTVLNAANGVPQVNIQTPSAAGVSRNTYRQFDVEGKGAILNNARTNARTQLGGWVEGNPWLGKGTARIIVNEVNSSDPSQLRGYIEVAGDRAQVIIANPAGLSCNGCGFINANQATLTTGKPQFNGGRLEGYQVQDGTITISGAGLDASRTDFTDIIARSVEVNAGIWANDLKVTTGANRVSADHKQTTAGTGTGEAPTVAIDVAQLGGMYAGKIMLVVTESGAGVRNAGQIGASVGEVVISAEGKLDNLGQVSAATVIQVDTHGGIENSGTLYARGDTSLFTRGDIDNHGTVAAQNNLTLSATGDTSQVHSGSDAVLAAGIDGNGKLGESGSLTIDATQGASSQGRNLAGENLKVTAADVDLSGSRTQAQNITLTAKTGNAELSTADLDATQTLNVTTERTLRTDGATLTAEQVQLSAHELSNVKGDIVQTGSADLHIDLPGDLDNSGGRIAANSHDLTLTAKTLRNEKGHIEHAGPGTLTLEADTFAGKEGTAASNGTLRLDADNATLDGGLTQAQKIHLDADSLSNQAGKILQVNTGEPLGQGGTTQASDEADLTITTQGRLDNTSGTISADGTATLTSDDLDNTQGKITAGKELHLTTAQLDNTRGTLAANGTVEVGATGIDNGDGSIGSVKAGVTLDTTLGKIANDGGRIQAAKDVTLKGQGIDNEGGTIVGENIDLNSRNQRLENHQGTLAARGTLDIHSGELGNEAGLIQATGALTVDTHGKTLTNTRSGTEGGILGQSGITLQTGDLTNSGGFIGAKGTLDITAAQVDNSASGQLASEKNLVITGSKTLDNQGGRIQALDTISIEVTERLDNEAGLIRSGSGLTLRAATVENASTKGNDQGIEGLSVDIDADRIDNQAGAIRADKTLSLTGRGIIDNERGLISSGQRLLVTDRDTAAKTQTLRNEAGTFIAGQSLSFDSASYSGNGKALSLGDLLLKLSGDYTHQGLLQANGALTLETQGTLANQGTLLAGTLLRLSGKNVENGAGGEIRGQQTRLSATGTVTNRGLIDGQLTQLFAPTFNNLGSGRLYGDTLAIAVGTLSNAAEANKAPVIAARERLDIGVQTLDNREHALIFSAGNLAIGGALDSAGQATGQAAEVNNASATLEALGNLDLSTSSLRNTNEHFSTRIVEIARESLQQFQLSGSPNRYDPAQVSVSHDEVDYLRTPEGRRDDWNRYDITRTTTETQVATSDPGQILAGARMHLTADSVVNDKSRIIAGGLLQADVGTLTNTEVAGRRTTTDSGTVTHFYRIQRKGRDDQGRSTSAYRPAATIQEISLQPTVYAQNTAPAGTGTQVDTRTTDTLEQKAEGASNANVALDQGRNVGAILQVQAASGTGVARQIRTGGLDTRVPDNSLFRPNPSASAGYLIETDPRFASYRTWLSSDYMLQRLALDPASTQQRLGDGFYEQQLIREQIAQLTGRRFLDNYSSDEAQYRALIDNAVTIASAWQLIPGVALTAEQMAQLTSDIVWLVEQDVVLPDGERRKVLVPQVYVRVQEGDLDGSGALIAGQTLDLDIRGDLINSGSLSGRGVMALTAENIHNLGGRIQGNDTALHARNDLNNLGGLIGATDSLTVSAGHDLNVISSTRSSDGEQGSRTQVSRIAGLFVSSPGATLRASAGHDLALDAAQVVNAGQDGTTQLVAGRDLNLGTVGEASQESIRWNGSNWRNDSSRSEVGSSIQAQGDVRLGAGHDLNAKAANVTSQEGAVIATAGHDIRLTTGENFRGVDEAHKVKGGNGLFSKKTTTTRDVTEETTAQGSTFSGEHTSMQAGHDIDVTGSNVVSTAGTTLLAGNDINIEAASDSLYERHDKQVKKSGLFSGGGIALTIGTQQQGVDDRTTTRSAVASTVGATDGDVTLEAGRNYRQVGSQVAAPQGDIAIDAQRVDILEARNLSQRERETVFKQTGLTITITNPVISAIQTAQQMKHASEKTEDGRMKALAAATTALATHNAATAVAQNPAQAGGINISLSIGAQKSQGESIQTQDTAAGSTVAAGNDIAIRARGAGKDSDIRVQGSQIEAGHDATLHADGDIDLIAASNRAEQHSTNSGSSASVGIGFALGGTQNGFTLNLGVSGNRGNADGEDLTHTNTRVNAGNTLTLDSGADTTLRGAVASGKQVIAGVGGNLAIESLQDTSTYAVKEKSLGVGLSLCIPPFCYGASSASVNAGKTDIDSTYASVTEQSGIKAGDNGFDIRVGGNTDLAGAVIASTDKAVQDGRNHLSTGTLTYRDIRNEAEYDGSSFSVGGGYGTTVGKDQQGNAQAGPTQVPGSTLPNEGGFSATAPIAMNASDDAHSITRSGISGATISIRDDAKQQELTGQSGEETIANLNRDVSSDKDTSNALKPIFDEEEIRTGFEITGAFARETGTFLENRARESTRAKEELDKERAKPTDQQDPAKIAALTQTLKDNQTWEFGGTSRAVLTALTAAAAGNVTGSGAEMLQAAAVNYLQGLATQEVKLLADNLDSETARTALHAVVGCAGAAAQGAGCGSGALGAASSVVINNLLDQVNGEAGASLTPEEKENRRNLVQTLVSGITATAGGEVAVANTAAQIETENNAVWIPVIIGAAWLIDKGMTAYDAWQDIKAIRSGEKTLEDLAMEKGEEYVAQAIIGNLGKYGIRAVKYGGKWITKKIDGVDIPTNGSGSGVENIVESAPTKTTRSLEELLPSGKVPSVRNGEFNRWFDDLSPAELDVLWENKSTREAIEARIRQPGGLHEWCMVCRAPEFKRWGVSMDEIQRFRTRTTELKWVSPIDGQPGNHGGHASSVFHNELKSLIDNSRSLEDFNAGIIALRDRWKIDPKLLPPLPQRGNQ